MKKIQVIALAISTAFLFSCEVKNAKANDKDDIVVITDVEETDANKTEMNSSDYADSDSNKKATTYNTNTENNYKTNQNSSNNKKREKVKKRTYKMKDGKTIAYNLDSKGIVGFDDWQDFTIVNYELIDLAEVNPNNIVTFTKEERLRYLNKRIANLDKDIPEWLRTEEVMEDVADVKKEYIEYISALDAPQKEKNENMEELMEKFGDLREELDETVEQYTKIHKDAIEEFVEELEDGDYLEAIEEYNEEIKKLQKIKDN